jgi:hypothetical protein
MTHPKYLARAPVVRSGLKYACVACRRSYKRTVRSWPAPETLPCPNCAGSARWMALDFEPPAQDDLAGWRDVSVRIARASPGSPA